MPRQALVAETLSTWREAERLLETLPPSSPDHETIQRITLELRETYATLSDASEVSMALLEESRRTVQDAAVLLARLNRRPPRA
jgi:hypothetical protein